MDEKLKESQQKQTENPTKTTNNKIRQRKTHTENKTKQRQTPTENKTNKKQNKNEQTYRLKP